MTAERVCTRCKNARPATTEYFGRQKNGKYGLASWCKACRADYQREYMTNPENLLSHRVYQREYRAGHPELVERERARGREYRRRKRETGEAYIYLRKWWKTPAGRRLAQICSHRRVYRELNVGGNYTSDDIRILFKSQMGLCWWCEKPLEKYHIDHRIPVSRGGNSNPENLCLACPHCNMSKNNKLPQEWNGRLL